MQACSFHVTADYSVYSLQMSNEHSMTQGLRHKTDAHHKSHC